MSNEKRQDRRPPRRSNRNQQRDGNYKGKDNKYRGRGDYKDRSRSGPPGKPRVEERNNKLVFYVRSPPKFADDIIREDYVDPAIEKLNEGKIEEVIFKARGQAINVAVRAALMLEGIMGVMKQTIQISSQIENRGSKKSDRDDKTPRILSSMEISMKKF